MTLKTSYVKIVLIIVSTCVIANLIFLDILWFQNSKNESLANENIEDREIASSESEITCNEECMNNIALKVMLSSTPFPTSIMKDTSVIDSSVKEFFVPFGTGTNATDEWSDVDGLQAYVDLNSYGKIKRIQFEVSLHIPTGNQKAYARLYNVTAKHPVWFSEVSLEGGTPKLLISDPITLDAGNNLYQVQMKSTLKFSTSLAQSRLHIFTN